LELWDVLRWYAHNRGYDGNRAWSGRDLQAGQEDSEKQENARALYAKFGTRTMAETCCAVSGLDPLGAKISCNLSGEKRPKALNAAFPREDVEHEVLKILQKHTGVLPHMDDALVASLLTDWTAIPCDSIRLPGRFAQILSDGRQTPGGLLFGQLIPRFDNRIISRCPITFERVYQNVLSDSGDPTKAAHEAEKLSKVPGKKCPEFLRFRWAMQVANVQVANGDKSFRSLSREERIALDKKMQAAGALTPDKFKKAVREISASTRDNLDLMLSHPEAGQALVLDPARKALERTPWNSVFPALPENEQSHLITSLHRGKTVRLGSLVEKHPELQKTIEALVEAAKTKSLRGRKTTSTEELLQSTVRCEPIAGRAPYSREILRETAEFVFSTHQHPTEEGGPLYRSEAIRTAQLNRAIDEQTNNRLVRHRLLILERLHRDVLKEFAAGDPARVARVTIEVNRDLRDMSGKTAKLIAQEMGQRLANFSSVTKRLEKAFAGQNIRITPGLIRKARIAEDLGWKCPYTGKDYDEFDLLHRKVDKDHIIPRSERASDSLDSLVITFAEVNRMKRKRTAALFVEECQGQTVEGLPNLHIKTLSNYRKDVDNLETFKGHDDDKRRKRRRKDQLLLRDYVEKEFTPRDLTQTSQLVRLGAQLLERAYLAEKKKPVITSLPGSVTGAVRKSWDLLGCLATANPGILEPDGRVRTKTEIRGITHLHHALDACVLGLAGALLPRDGGAWELLIKRRLNSSEQARARSLFGRWIEISQDGQMRLAELPKALKEQVRLRLAERRVVQHQPVDLSGMACDQTVWRVFDPMDCHPNAKRLGRWLEQKEVSVPPPDAPTVVIISRKRKLSADAKSSGKKVLRETKTWTWSYDIKDKTALIGLNPVGDLATAKLRGLKAVKILGDNFGIALDPEPTIIRPLRIWHQIDALRAKNGGKPPRILRIGNIIQIREKSLKSDYRGLWMLRGVQLNQRSGFLVDISPADHITYRGVRGCFQQVSLATLLKCGLTIKTASLAGIPAPDVASEPQMR